VCCTLEAEGSNYYDDISAMVHGEASPLGDGGPSAELEAVPNPVAGALITGPMFVRTR
jgi:hypothetical protein